MVPKGSCVRFYRLFETDGHKDSSKWPSCTSARCWNCCGNVNGPPLSIPTEPCPDENAKISRWVLEGVFCSMPCLRRHLIDSNYPNVHTLLTRAQHFARSVVKLPIERLCGLAPSRCFLKMFGGPMTPDEYHAAARGDLGPPQKTISAHSSQQNLPGRVMRAPFVTHAMVTHQYGFFPDKPKQSNQRQFVGKICGLRRPTEPKNCPKTKPMHQTYLEEDKHTNKEGLFEAFVQKQSNKRSKSKKKTKKKSPNLTADVLAPDQPTMPLPKKKERRQKSVRPKKRPRCDAVETVRAPPNPAPFPLPDNAGVQGAGLAHADVQTRASPTHLPRQKKSTTTTKTRPRSRACAGTSRRLRGQTTLFSYMK